MRRLSIGILAHVDAGKTTLSEGLLYESGMIRTLGRVDNQNAFLDTEKLERARGITIFSKQAVMRCKDTTITLLDTPGHVDFSAEMERTLWVMDYAILVISGTDGVQGHTLTLWRLLERYGIPVFIFVNKMDQPDTDRDQILRELQKEFGEGCICFEEDEGELFYEQVAVCEEAMLERYLEGGTIAKADIKELIRARKIFPCFFGSALQSDGVDRFLQGLLDYTIQPAASTQFGAKVFKIARDSQGNRLTYVKITGGQLRVKDTIRGSFGMRSGIDSLEEDIRSSALWEEKVNQIRVYSGEKYEAVQEAVSGMICALTGLTRTVPGEGLGMEEDSDLPVLEPVLTYTVELPEDIDAVTMLTYLRQMEEEEPDLHVLWREQTGSIQMKLMGEVQTDVLRRRIEDRFGVTVGFGTGRIAYKETIADAVVGIGHFEPLKHYAEVHLLLESGEEGSGMQFLADCSEDILDRNWQRLILTHLEEKEHVGVLTGSPLTDMRITVVAGRAHTKHTEGGDFRQATYRAIRQGLMQAQSVLLEPYYTFRLEVPAETIGRAMTDLEHMGAEFEAPEIEEGKGILCGVVPVATIQGYQITLNSYTKGKGTLFCTMKGYAPCHNSQEVIEEIGYAPEQDIENPSTSVFCAHGAGFIVPWDQVSQYMHVESGISLQGTQDIDWNMRGTETEAERMYDNFIDEEQIEAILNRTFRANQKTSKRPCKKHKPSPPVTYKGTTRPQSQKKYLIVDGYNIVHAWDELKELLPEHLEGARMKLMDQLCDYQALTKVELILVFDAYKVKGNLGEMFDYHNIHVVYTKEAETADAYIEKLTHKIARREQVTVATSDGLVQLITRGQNCQILSARELKEELERAKETIRAYLT